MEATKKKKAYLKPEMTKFEMKTEVTFMAVSFKEEEDFTQEEFQAIPPCLSGGGQSFITNYKYAVAPLRYYDSWQEECYSNTIFMVYDKDYDREFKNEEKALSDFGIRFGFLG